jgi:hypothetical protein
LFTSEKPKKGGARPGSGRPRGSKNTRTAELARKAAEEGKTPLEVLLDFMRTDINPAVRMDAAKAAAPYIHPKLANVDIGNKGNKPFQITSVETDKGLL